LEMILGTASEPESRIVFKARWERFIITTPEYP
jgi:hypothetical protein